MGPTRLEHAERIVLDRRPVDELAAALGPERAGRLVDAAMEEMAVWLGRAEVLRRRGDMAELARLALRIGTVAERLGMGLLARLAGAVGALCGAGDPAALAAVTSRMVRAGEGSLLAVWELEGVRE